VWRLRLRLQNIIILSSSIHISGLLPLVLIIEKFTFPLLFQQVFLRPVLLGADPLIDTSLVPLKVMRDMIESLVPRCIAPFFELLYGFTQATPERTLAVLANPAVLYTCLDYLMRELMLYLQVASKCSFSMKVYTANLACL
jgi:hypothetical protein